MVPWSDPSVQAHTPRRLSYRMPASGRKRPSGSHYAPILAFAAMSGGSSSGRGPGVGVQTRNPMNGRAQRSSTSSIGLKRVLMLSRVQGPEAGGGAAAEDLDHLPAVGQAGHDLVADQGSRVVVAAAEDQVLAVRSMARRRDDEVAER
jgi:hypothetical protein